MQEQLYDSSYQEALRRVKAKQGFYIHLSVYLAVNLFLVAIYLVTSWQINDYTFPWFIFPLGGWSIGVVAHAISVYLTATHVHQRMLASEMQRMGIPPVAMYPPETSHTYDASATKTQSQPVAHG